MKNNEREAEIQNQGLHPHPEGGIRERGRVRKEKVGLGT